VETKRIEFLNEKGHRLAGRLELPAGREQVAYALFAHCFTCSKDYKAVANVSRALAGEGITVLRFDFTGLGESEGEFSDTNFSSNVDDLVAAARYLAEEYESPKILIGHSLGGAAVLQAASRIPSAAAVATIAAPSDPKRLSRLYTGRGRELDERGEIEVSIAGRPFRIKKQFADDLERTHMDETIRNLRRALIVFHSPLDEVVSIENAAHIFKTAKHPKSFVSLDRADHLLTREEDSLYVGRVIAAWASRYVGATEES